MALSFVGYRSAIGSSVALPTFVTGDLALVAVYRDGSNTSPSIASGWTTLAAQGANSNSLRIGYRVLQTGDSTTGTWTNATEIQVIVLRGQLDTTPIGAAFGIASAASSLIQYAGLTYTAPSTSWGIGFAGHRTATNVNSASVTGWTNRSTGSTTPSVSCHTDASPTNLDPTDFSVNTTAAWRSYVVEVLAGPSTAETSTARVSFAPGQTPDTRTRHEVVVRARVTSAADVGQIGATLYVGATPIGSEVLSSELTTLFANYSIAIPDADAATITSYSNLEVRLRGYSSAGDTAVFEIAGVELRLPISTVGETFGAVVAPFIIGSSVAGVVTSGGAKGTDVVRLSLEMGFVPLTRTDHEVLVRARKVNAAHSGKIHALLYEGTTLITAAEIVSDELTDSLANYSLAIPDADAATISSYSDLEVRLRGVSAGGDLAVFEIAQASLIIPAPGSGGDVFGQAQISALGTISADSSGSDIYPGAAVYPKDAATVLSASSITASVGVTDTFGKVVLPLVLERVTSGDSPLTERTGIVLLPAVSTIASTGTVEIHASVSVDSECFVELEGEDTNRLLADFDLITFTEGRVSVAIAGAAVCLSESAIAARLLIDPILGVGEPGTTLIDDRELATCWIGDERDVFSCVLDTDTSPVYAVAVRTD
jgi:hypothetical protein